MLSVITGLRKRGYRIICAKGSYKLLSEPTREPNGWQRLFAVFAARPNELVSKAMLQDRSGLRPSTVNVVIHHLRKQGYRIGNVHGKGYIFYV